MDWVSIKIDKPSGEPPVADPEDTLSLAAPQGKKSLPPAKASSSADTRQTKADRSIEPPRRKAPRETVPRTLAVFETMGGAGAVPGPGENGPLINEKTCIKWDRHGTLAGNRPSYREVDGVIGLAQPTPDGVASTLEELKSRGTGFPDNKVVWTNLREEPVIYIQGKSFTLRNRDNIKENIEFPGINPDQVDGLEQKFRREILERLDRGEDIYYYTEDANGNLGQDVIKASSVQADDVKTMRSLFDDFIKKGYNLDFQRVPISDERRPEDSDFDALTERFRNAAEGSFHVINCQGGGGRTTTGMVVFSIMKQSRRIAKTGEDEPLIRNAAVREDLREAANGNPSDYRPLISIGMLTQMAVNLFFLQNGDMKDFNKVIEEQGAKGSNLLKVIDKFAGKDPERAANFLERYLYLSVFKQYCLEEGPSYGKPFSEWVKPHGNKIDTVLIGLKAMCHIPQG
jgi:hypothetical protein